MGIGSNLAVEDAEESYRDSCAERIAEIAAPLVADGMERGDAIAEAAEYLRNESEAEGDPTGVAEVENEYPSPSKKIPRKQVDAIKAELMDAAREAADNL